MNPTSPQPVEPRKTSPRLQFREARQRRQNLAFSVIVSIMAALSLLSLLVFTGILPAPFFNEFSEGKEEVRAGEVPCFPEGSKPASLDGIHATVLNATGRPGLAHSIAESLEAQGVTVDATGNYEGQFYGTVKLTAGRSQVVAAYTLARAFTDSTVRYAPSDPASVTIILGERFTDLPSSEEVAALLSNTEPLKQVENCKLIPAEDETEQPGEEETSPSETGTEQATEPEPSE